MVKLLPTELLKIGTRVMVVNHGWAVVEKAEWAKDQFQKDICLHTLRYEESGKVKPCNYSFILYEASSQT